MKTSISKFCTAFAIAMAFAWSVSAQTITLDLQSNSCAYNGLPPIALNPADTVPGTYTSDPSTNIGGGYWTKTYNDSTKYTSIGFGEFVFSHLPAGPGASFSGYYWDGFTLGSNGDKRNFGYNSATVGSVNWISNQWGVMADGGIESISGNEVVSVDKDIPYLIAYWGYHMEPEWWHMHFGNIPPSPMHCLTANVINSSGDTVLFAPQEVYICNHPWPYYGNLYGDGFASAFESGDYFYLYIHAIKADGREDSTFVNLASFERTLVQDSTWQHVDLTSLFNYDNDSIKTLYFTMKTTDQDATWGPNTAVYFCMDKLKVNKQGTAPASAATAIQTTSTKAAIAKSKATKALEIKDYFPVASYTGGEVIVYDSNGKEVLKTTVKAGEKINLSKLPSGEYGIRHGHKFILVKKVK